MIRPRWTKIEILVMSLYCLVLSPYILLAHSIGYVAMIIKGISVILEELSTVIQACSSWMLVPTAMGLSWILRKMGNETHIKVHERKLKRAIKRKRGNAKVVK